MKMFQDGSSCCLFFQAAGNDVAGINQGVFNGGPPGFMDMNRRVDNDIDLAGNQIKGIWGQHNYGIFNSNR